MASRIGWLDLDGHGAHYFNAELQSLCGELTLPEYVSDGPDPEREAAIIQFARRERGGGLRCPICVELVGQIDAGETAATVDPAKSSDCA